MAFRPDIIVTGPESSGIALVVEVKASTHDLQNSERQLKRYMAGMRCPVGLLVTPERLWLYRDRYQGAPDDSIVRVGEFDVRNVLNFAPSSDAHRDAVEFERFVQAWLESLSTESGLRGLPAELRRAVEFYIVPAVSEGTIGAGHPRPALSA